MVLELREVVRRPDSREELFLHIHQIRIFRVTSSSYSNYRRELAHFNRTRGHVRRSLGLGCKGLNFQKASLILLVRTGLLLLLMWKGEYTIILGNPVFFNKESGSKVGNDRGFQKPDSICVFRNSKETST